MARLKNTTPAGRQARSGATKARAKAFRATREAHSRELAEDYVEAISDLIGEAGEARVTDLARRLGVTHVTVNKTVARLQQGGFVTSQPYRSIFLTEKGRRIAAESKRRHETVVRFLRMLGVPEADACSDAEGIEHHVSPATLQAFERLLEKNAA